MLPLSPPRCSQVGSWAQSSSYRKHSFFNKCPFVITIGAFRLIGQGSTRTYVLVAAADVILMMI